MWSLKILTLKENKLESPQQVVTYVKIPELRQQQLEELLSIHGHIFTKRHVECQQTGLAVLNEVFLVFPQSIQQTPGWCFD
jgi:hypothetical protein